MITETEQTFPVHIPDVIEKHNTSKILGDIGNSEIKLVERAMS